MSLNNKLVLVTGATSGIGRACAHAYAKQGAHLIITGRRTERLIELEKELQEINQSIRLLSLSFDVRNRQQVFSTLEHLPEAFKQIDIIINNAGLAAGLASVQDADIDDWEQMIDTNMKGLLYVTKALLPGMIARNNGHILNIGSVAGHWTYPSGSVYCATKSAVGVISESLRKDLLGHNIRVTTISPGLVDTEFSLVRFKGDKNKADNVYDGLTVLSADDIADAIIYATSCPPHVNIHELVITPVAQAGVGPDMVKAV